MCVGGWGGFLLLSTSLICTDFPAFSEVLHFHAQLHLVARLETLTELATGQKSYLLQGRAGQSASFGG